VSVICPPHAFVLPKASSALDVFSHDLASAGTPFAPIFKSPDQQRNGRTADDETGSRKSVSI